jgi:hypothetical protein
MFTEIGESFSDLTLKILKGINIQTDKFLYTMILPLKWESLEGTPEIKNLVDYIQRFVMLLNTDIPLS